MVSQFRLLALRSTGNRKDFIGKSCGQSIGRQLLESCVQRHRGQVHRRVGQADQGDVQLRERPPALHHLHGRDRRHWWKKVQRGHQCRQRDPGSHHEIVPWIMTEVDVFWLQRTLMELLNQMDGFDVLGKVCVILWIYQIYQTLWNDNMPNISGQDDYGNQPTRHSGPCSSEAWKVFSFWFCLGINSKSTTYLDWIVRSRSLCRTSKPAWRCSRSTPTPSQRYPHLCD